MKKILLTTILSTTSVTAMAQFLNLAAGPTSARPSAQEVMAKIMYKVLPDVNVAIGTNTWSKEKIEGTTSTNRTVTGTDTATVTDRHVAAELPKAPPVPAFISSKPSRVSKEVEITAADKFDIKLTKRALNLKPIVKLASPPVLDFDTKKFQMLLVGTTDKGQVISKPKAVKELEAIYTPVIAETHLDTKPLIAMKEADYKLLEALIYLDDHKNYEQAMALLAEVMRGSDYKYEALYIYALTAQGLKLNSEFRYNMFRVAKESKDPALQLEATEALVKYVESLELNDMKELEPLVAKFDVNTTENDAYNFFRAKYFLEEGHLGQVEDALLFVPEKSKYYGDALLISALYNYRRGKIDETIFDLGKLSKILAKYSRLQGIANLTLARAYFQKGMYKEASQAYLKVNKADPVWTQAMVEQAWTQILMQDYEGAAGNMFTLHTDFFKNAFAPESYVVRTVGYLNLCQYGDGMQVLKNLHNKYGPLYERLSSYKSTTKENIAYYDTIKKWFRSPEQSEVDGLPRSFIIELGRHPSFMKIQSQINNFEDELEGFNKATLNIIAREKALIKKQTEVKDEVAKLEKRKRDGKVNGAQMNMDLSYQQKRLVAYKMQYQLTSRARTLIKELREKAVARIDKEKVGLREKAGKALKERFSTILADLKKTLDQNDVLNYELYSGAGEHLRYQMAGGDTKDKDARKPANEKQVSWKFKGEIWEDEVGHFRSSLENVCPKEDKGVASAR
jgi:hypothetical protein